MEEVLSNIPPYIKIILLGIPPAIISSIIIVAYLEIWQRILKPWIQNLLYTDVSLKGEWIGYGNDEFGDFTLKINVRQIANKVNGSVQRIQQNKETANYQFSNGIVKNSILSIIYTERKDNKKRFDQGNFIGKIEQGGAIIKGMLSYLSNVNNDSLKTMEISFTRINDGAESITGRSLCLKNQ